MSQFLRDERLNNLTLPLSSLRELDILIAEITEQHNAPLRAKYPEIADQAKNGAIFRKVIIRFDGKGFQLFDFNEVLGYLSTAKHIERVCFFVEPAIPAPGALQGKRIDLKLDTQQPDNCVLVVQDDDKLWTESVFLRIHEHLTRHTNRSGWLRNTLADTLVQLLLAGVMFIVCIGGALMLSPHLKLVYAPMFVFLACFLFFSHLWNLFLGAYFWLRDKFFPNITFREPERLHWAIEALLGTGAAYLVAIGVSKLIGIIASVYRQVVVTSP